MKKTEYGKIIGAFLTIAIIGITFLKSLWVGEKLDTYVFSYLFGISKYYIYALIVLVCVITLIKKEHEIRKINFIIGVSLFSICIISIGASATSETMGLRGIDAAYAEFENGFDHYKTIADVQWISGDIEGGVIGSFLSGLIGYASVVVSIIVYSLLSLVGVSLVLWGTYSEIYKKIWKHTNLKKLSWKNIKGKNIKRILFGDDGDGGIAPLQEDEKDISQHAKIDSDDSEPFIELSDEEFSESKSDYKKVDITLQQDLKNEYVEVIKPSDKPVETNKYSDEEEFDSLIDNETEKPDEEGNVLDMMKEDKESEIEETGEHQYTHNHNFDEEDKEAETEEKDEVLDNVTDGLVEYTDDQGEKIEEESDEEQDFDEHDEHDEGFEEKPDEEQNEHDEVPEEQSDVEQAYEADEEDEHDEEFRKSYGWETNEDTSDHEQKVFEDDELENEENDKDLILPYGEIKDDK